MPPHVHKWRSSLLTSLCYLSATASLPLEASPNPRELLYNGQLEVEGVHDDEPLRLLGGDIVGLLSGLTDLLVDPVCEVPQDH